jgi:hypothetical protein
MTTQEINKRFAELAGWKMDPESEVLYRRVFISEGLPEDTELPVPDFCKDPRLVLREMKRLGKLRAFMMWLWDSESTEDDLGNVLMSGESFLKLIDYILDTTGKLAMKGISWTEAKK